MRVLFLNGSSDYRPPNNAYFNIEDPSEFFKSRDINTGDVLVYDSLLKIVQFDAFENIQFDQQNWEECVDGFEPDVCVIRGSNYLTQSLDLGHCVPLIEKLRCPVVGIGIGMQASRPEALTVPEGSQRFWQVVAGKSHSLGVRGIRSAEAFERIGVKNVEPIGCPSIYRTQKPEMKISRPEKPFEDWNIGSTFNSYLRDDYASNATKTLRIQRELMRQIALNPKGRIYSQGEREESLAVHGKGDQRATAIASIAAKFDLASDGALDNLLWNRLSAFFDVSEWSAHIRDNIDAMAGVRLHGNIVALQQEKPCVFFTYDVRIREIVDLFRLPFVEVDTFMPFTLKELFENADFAQFEDAYRRNFAVFRSFLNRNGVPHALPEPVLMCGSSEPRSVDLSRLRADDAASLVAWYAREYDSLCSRIDRLEKWAWGLHLQVQAQDAAAALGTSE